MSSSHVQRYKPVRRRSPASPIVTCGVVGFGLLLICGLSALLVLPRIGGIAAGVAGLREAGQTESVFSNVPTPAPIQINNGVLESQVLVTVPDYGQSMVDVQPELLQIVSGTDDSGQPATVVTVSEHNAITLCARYTPLCQNADPRFQNLTIDLRPGGAIVYADVTVPELGGVSQRVGAIMRVDASGRQVEFEGVDIGGTRYTAPPGTLANQITQYEQVANDVLQQVIVQAGGGSYRLSDILINDSSMTLVMR
ncbi:MAG: hypothetical protein IT320_24600 [Anaerolineae bacterium]|nr:hypothetical protein [Anaerolineae bacterium]